MALVFGYDEKTAKSISRFKSSLDLISMTKERKNHPKVVSANVFENTVQSNTPYLVVGTFESLLHYNLFKIHSQTVENSLTVITSPMRGSPLIVKKID